MSIINKKLTEILRDHISSQCETIRTQLTELAASPSIHGTEETEQACIGAAQAITDMYAELGIELEAHHTVDGSIILSGFAPGSSESAKTVLLYSHYDVQPTGGKSAWTADSWTFDERNGRRYGRGTTDCKDNMVMHLAVLHALRDDALAGCVDILNIKLIVEGSEERGSAGLNNLIATQPEFFDADVILTADVDNAKVGQPTLVITLRGTVDMEVRVDILGQPVHSGTFSGAAPDALTTLVRIFDSLRDEDGFTSIDGLDYSQRWKSLDYAPETLRADAEVPGDVDLISSEDVSVSDLTWTRPSVIVTGINCPPATSAANTTPSTIMTYTNFRTLGGVDPAEARGAPEDHLYVHVPWGVEATVECDELANPFQANVEDKVVQLAADSLPAAYGKRTASMGEGTSIPLCTTLLEAVPGVDIALYGMEEPQARIHSTDESANSNETRDIAIGEAVFLASINGI